MIVKLRIQFYILWIISLIKIHEYVFLFEPTTPFRKKKTVIDCFKILKKNNINSVFTVCKVINIMEEIKTTIFFH